MTRMRPCIIVVLLFLVGHASIANADAGTDARSAGTTSAIGWVKRKNQTIVKKTVHSNRFSSDTVLTRRRALLKCRGGGGGGRGGNVACRAGRTAGFPLPAAKEWAARAWGRVQQPALPKTSSAEVVVRGGGATTTPVKDEVTKEAYKSAVLKTCLLIFCAGAFGLGTMVVKGQQAGLEFFAGYIVEQSLSVDNLFIFIMLFDYFKVPAEFQSRVLNWGIIGAMAMRAVMIVVGVAAIQRFRWVMLFFAGILVVSSVNLLLEKAEEDHDDLENNTVLKIAKWMCDSTDYYDGEKFFTLVDGVKKATPLLLCLICIELSDFVFAVDSIPAVLGISHDTFIVYSSNVFAICAMRSVYTLVSHAISDLPYLKPAVALVLGFVGIKMFLEFFHHEVDIGISLSVVSGILAVGAIASIISNRNRAAAAAAGAESHSEGLTFRPHAAGGGDGNAPLHSASAFPLTDAQEEDMKKARVSFRELAEGPVNQGGDFVACVTQTARGAASDGSGSVALKMEEGVDAAEGSVDGFGAKAEGAPERVTERADGVMHGLSKSASPGVEGVIKEGKAAVADAFEGFAVVVEANAEGLASAEADGNGRDATEDSRGHAGVSERRQSEGDKSRRQEDATGGF